MLRAMMHAIQASKLRWRLLDQSVKPLSFERAFYLATMGGGQFFGKVGSFLDGYELDAVVLDDAGLEHPQPLSAARPMVFMKLDLPQPGPPLMTHRKSSGLRQKPE